MEHLSNNASKVTYMSKYIYRRIYKYVKRNGIDASYEALDADDEHVMGNDYESILTILNVYLGVNKNYEYNVLYRCLFLNMEKTARLRLGEETVPNIDNGTVERCKSVFKSIYREKLKNYEITTGRAFPNTWSDKCAVKKLESLFVSKLIRYVYMYVISHKDEFRYLCNESLNMCEKCWEKSCNWIEDGIVFVDIDNTYFLLNRLVSSAQRRDLPHNCSLSTENKNALCILPLVTFKNNSSVYKFLLKHFIFSKTPFDDAITYLNYKLIEEDDYGCGRLQLLANVGWYLKYSTVYRLTFSPNAHSILKLPTLTEIHPWELTYSSIHSP